MIVDEITLSSGKPNLLIKNKEVSTAPLLNSPKQKTRYSSTMLAMHLES